MDRAAAGVVLGRLGDRREGVGLTDAGLPDTDWIHIPKGEFWMGDREDYGGGQRWECPLLTQPDRLSRYPVTVVQYQAFVDKGGYAQAQCWAEAGKAGYWRDGKVRSRDWNRGGEVEWRDSPGDSGARFRLPNAPVVDVNWFEVVAFCRWLSKQLGFAVGLPSEAEWERAARHTDARLYPWGNSTDDVARRCNISNTGIGHPSAVGMFPDGRAECGALDMAGNGLGMVPHETPREL